MGNEKLDLRKLTNAAMMSALAGATRKASAILGRSMWDTGDSFARSKSSSTVRCRVSVSNTTGSMNRQAFFVMIT